MERNLFHCLVYLFEKNKFNKKFFHVNSQPHVSDDRIVAVEQKILSENNKETICMKNKNCLTIEKYSQNFLNLTQLKLNDYIKLGEEGKREYIKWYKLKESSEQTATWVQ